MANTPGFVWNFPDLNDGAPWLAFPIDARQAA
jgi:hypothetical protein